MRLGEAELLTATQRPTGRLRFKLKTVSRARAFPCTTEPPLS